MKYKMICSDLDDTLLTSDGECPQKVIDAIHRYINLGGKFVICTGRMTASVVPFCKRIGLHGEVISYQGAVTSDIDTGAILDMVTIDYNLARQVGEYLEKKGYYYQTYYPNYFVTERATDYTLAYAKVSNGQYKELGYKLSEHFNKEKLCPPKILCLAQPEAVPDIIKELTEVFGENLLINTSKDWIVEIVPKATNKGIAVAKLAQKYNIERSEIICVGDSANDSTMIEYAGLGAVVRNGTAAGRKYAKIIVPSNDEAGVAFLLDNYGNL